MEASSVIESRIFRNEFLVRARDGSLGGCFICFKTLPIPSFTLNAGCFLRRPTNKASTFLPCDIFLCACFQSRSRKWRETHLTSTLFIHGLDDPLTSLIQKPCQRVHVGVPVVILDLKG